MIPSFEQLLSVSMETMDVPLDVDDQEHAISMLNGKLVLIDDCRQVIADKQAVCRDQVSDLVSECDMVLPDNAPLNSFTEQLSTTNLSVAIEGIWQTTKDVLNAIVQKIGEILTKIFDWIRRLLDPYFKHSKNYVAIRDRLNALFHAEEELKKLLPPGHVMISAADRDTFESLDRENAALKETWLNEWSGLTQDVLNNGPYITAMRVAATTSDQLFRLLHSKIMILSELLNESHRDPNQSSILTDILEKLDAVATPVDTRPLMAAVSLIKHDFKFDPNNSISIYTGMLFEEHKRLEALKPSPPMDIQMATAHIVSRNQPMEELMLPVEDILKEMNSYENAVKAMMKARPRDDMSGSISRAFANATRTLVDEFVGLQIILKQSVRDNMFQERLMVMASKHCYNDINSAMIQIRLAGDTAVIEQAEAILKKAKEAFKPY